MTLEIRTGDPVMDGLYVIYSTGLAGYTERELVMWRAKGGWHYRFSEEKYHDPVFGWIGPLPHNFLMAQAAAPTQEYDL